MKTQRQRFEEYAIEELQIDPVWMSEGFYDEQKDRYALNDIQRDYEDFKINDSQWLESCQLPEDGVLVLLLHNGTIFTGYYNAEDGYWFDSKWATLYTDPTHWMPLPEKPEVEP